MRKVITSLGKYYYPTRGGVEKVTKDIAEIVDEFGYESRVISFDGEKNRPEKNIINNVKVFRYKPIKIGPAPFSIKFYKNSKDIIENSDLIIAHYPNPIVENAILKYKGDKKIILFYHSDLIGYNKILTNLYNNHTQKILNKVDKIIVTSPNYAKTSINLKNFKNKIEIVPLTIDPNKFDTEKTYKFDNFNYKNKILFVGRFVKYKGLEYLIKSLNYLNDEYGLVIVGGGKRYKKYKKIINKYHLNNRIKFINNPSNEDLKNIYNSVDIFVLPSIMRSEAFGIVSLEAMYNRLPIVTTELGTGTSYYNIDGETGYVVTPKNEEYLAKSIKKGLQNKQKLGQKSRNRIINNFTHSIFKEKIINSIKDILN